MGSGQRIRAIASTQYKPAHYLKAAIGPQLCAPTLTEVKLAFAPHFKAMESFVSCVHRFATMVSEQCCYDHIISQGSFKAERPR